DGAARLAARVFDRAEAGPVEDDAPYAAMHGLYWLIANLAARRPLVIAVDDAHWADAPSLRWLAPLAARIEGLPAALLLAVRSGPGERAAVGELRACRAATPLRLEPLDRETTALFVRERLGSQADDTLCLACHASTGGNPFLLESLAAALRAPGDSDPLARGGGLGAEPAGRGPLRPVAPLGAGGRPGTRGPAGPARPGGRGAAAPRAG